jgi:Ethanolamine utilization protein EutJ (predicted chaperonin)
MTSSEEVLTTVARTMREGDVVWLIDRDGNPLGKVCLEKSRAGRSRVVFTARRWIRILRRDEEAKDG